MSGRMQKDTLLGTPARVVLPEWKSATKFRGMFKYPNGALTMECSSTDSQYLIARYKSENGSWNFRSSISDDEMFKEPELEFLVADNESVCWKALEMDSLPKYDLTVTLTENGRKYNAWIGNHIKFGVGLLKRTGNKLTYICGENKCTDNSKITVLCNKKK